MKDSNRVIAEFMCLPAYTDAVDDRTLAYYVGESIIHTDNTDNENDDDVYHPEDMQFHISWDWLMPVVQKISNDHLEMPLNETITHLTDFNQENIWDFKTLHTAVVEFIKFFNENNDYYYTKQEEL